MASPAAAFRIAAASIAAYDLLLTAPAEWRYYRRQYHRARISPGLILYIIVRYMGTFNITMGLVGFFKHGFSEEMCSHWYYIPPVSRVILASSSRAVILWRTWAITRKNQKILWCLSALFALCSAADSFSIGFEVMRQDSEILNCFSIAKPGTSFKWIFYVSNSVFDMTAMTISGVFLFKNSSLTGIWQPLSKLLLQDGIIYLVFLTFVNVLNIIFLLQSNTSLQAATQTLGVAAVMILTQRIIISIQEATIQLSSDSESSRSRSRGRPYQGGPSKSTQRHEMELGIRVHHQTVSHADDLAEPRTTVVRLDDGDLDMQKIQTASAATDEEYNKKSPTAGRDW